MHWKSYLTLALVSLLDHGAVTEVCAGPLGVLPQGRVPGQAGVSREGNVAVFTATSIPAQLWSATIDYVHAQPMELPRIPAGSAAEEQSDSINALTAPSALGAPIWRHTKIWIRRGHSLFVCHCQLVRQCKWLHG